MARFPRPEWNDLRAAVFEFFGTTLFLYFALSGCRSANVIAARTTKGGDIPSYGLDAPQLDYCAKSFALSLMIWVAVFGRVTGGVFNPAIALALWLVDALSAWRAILYVIAQIVGSIVASALVKGIVPGTPSPSTHIATTLSPGTSYAQGVFLEAFATGMLVIVVFASVIDKRVGTGRFIAPFAIGGALYLCHLATINYTSTGVNPARSFGPAVIFGFNSDQWVYWVGPLIGALAASLFYKTLYWYEYWTFGYVVEDPKPNVNEVILRPPPETERPILAARASSVQNGRFGIRKTGAPTGSSTASITEGGISSPGHGRAHGSHGADGAEDQHRDKLPPVGEV